VALIFPVQVTGAEAGERALGRVADAATRAEQRLESAGRGTGGLSAAMERLDGAVDRVERPMRALNGALDVASVALGVGLAGPLGVVIGQLGDMALRLRDAIEVTAPYERATLDAAAAAAQLATAEQAAAAAFRARLDAQRAAGTSAVSRAVETIGAGLDELTLERIISAGQRLESLTQQRTALLGTLNVRGVTAASARELDDLTRAIERARAELRALGADGASLSAPQQDGVAAPRGVRAQDRGVSTLSLIEGAPTQSLADRLGLGPSPVATPAREPTALELAEQLPTGQQPIGEAIGIGPAEVAQATAAEQALRGTLAASQDLGSLGAAALQQFSAAAGAALAAVIIGSDGAGKSFKRVAGEVAAGLSAQALGYAVFLGALGAAAAATGPVLGFGAPALFSAAATMGVAGVALGLTARALGAGASGASARPSAAGGGAGGGDRVSSLSSGPGGAAQPISVTVVLGVEQVSSVLVDGARRAARAGGLSGGRLAVA
jgi:hypothetical protein